MLDFVHVIISICHHIPFNVLKAKNIALYGKIVKRTKSTVLIYSIYTSTEKLIKYTVEY